MKLPPRVCMLSMKASRSTTFTQRYSHGAELWDDGNIVAVDIKLASPPAMRGGFRLVDSQSKGRKQCVCSAPELIVKQSLQRYFMTPCQATQQQ
eukprot:1185814-Pyramimonas_sp.AAC.1